MAAVLYDDIKNTSIWTDHCNNSHISTSYIPNSGKPGMMLHAYIWAGHDTIPVN